MSPLFEHLKKLTIELLETLLYLLKGTPQC